MPPVKTPSTSMEVLHHHLNLLRPDHLLPLLLAANDSDWFYSLPDLTVSIALSMTSPALDLRWDNSATTAVISPSFPLSPPSPAPHSLLLSDLFHLRAILSSIWSSHNHHCFIITVHTSQRFVATWKGPKALDLKQERESGWVNLYWFNWLWFLKLTC